MKRTIQQRKKNRLRTWLKTHYSVFNIAGMEQILSFPKGTIHKFIKYDRKLTDDRFKKLDELIQYVIHSYEEKK